MVFFYLLYKDMTRKLFTVKSYKRRQIFLKNIFPPKKVKKSALFRITF